MTDKHSSYKSFNELLTNEKFLRWRLFPDEELDAYWQRLQLQHPTLENDIALCDYYLKKHVFKTSLPAHDKQQLLNKILQTINGPEQTATDKGKKRFIPALLKYAAAACLIIALGYFMFRPYNHPAPKKELIVGSQLLSKDVLLVTGNHTSTFQSNVNIKIDSSGIAKIVANNSHAEAVKIASHEMNKLIVPYGKRSTIELPDGTTITINSGSELEFPTAFGPTERKIKVKGEMYMEVAPDRKRPFYVDVSGFTVQVLGTKFNVSAYDNFVKSVTLVQGSVNLTAAGSTMRLSPGEQATYKAQGGFGKKRVNTNIYTSWKDGYLMLEHTPIADVLPYLERYYNLSLRYDQARLKNITCQGKLYLSDNLDNVMNIVALLSSTTYTRAGSVIYFKNKLRHK